MPCSRLGTGLFFDEKRSVQYLQEHAKEFMLESEEFDSFGDGLPSGGVNGGAVAAA